MLERIALFSSLDKDQVRQLEKLTTRKIFSKGTVIAKAGDLDNSMYFINTGEVNVYISTEESNGKVKEVIINTLSEKQYFGELSVIDCQPRSANVVTTKHSELYILKQDALTEFLLKHPSTCLSLLQYFSSEIRRLTEEVGGYALHNAYYRFRKVLYQLSKEVGGKQVIQKIPGPSELARRAGTTPKMVNTLFSFLQDKGYIKGINARNLVLEKTLPENLS